MEWHVTGSLEPSEGGGFVIDLAMTRTGGSRKAASGPKVSVDESNLAEAVEKIEELVGDRLALLAGQMVSLMAEQNKTGKVSLGRALREIYIPLEKLERDAGREAAEYGMEAALAKGAPNINYAKKAAASCAAGTVSGSDPYELAGGGHE
jgi:hypothetical protein